MNSIPENCPLTREQFDRLPPAVQTSKTMIWVKDADDPDPETLDAILSVCNLDILPSLAPLYFAQQQQPITAAAGVLEKVQANVT